jgi:hypothetical protein
MSEDLVFIGGPRDGYRIKVPDNYPSVTVPLANRERMNVFGPNTLSDVVTIERATYRRERVLFGDKHIGFLVITGMETEEAFKLLLDSYSTRWVRE